MLFASMLLLGIVAGLRAATALAAVSIAAWLGWLDLSGTWAAFVGHIVTVVVLVILALLEFVGDQLPNTPSRKTPPAFTGRVVGGALVGLVVGLPSGNWIAGLIIGIIGAVIGTLGGYEARKWVAGLIGRDLPAGLLEDFIAVVIALWAVSSL